MERSLIKQYLRPLIPEPTSLKPRGKLRQKIACFLFDIYGTLFISGSGDISTGRENPPGNDQIRLLLDRYSISRLPGEVLLQLRQSIKERHNVLRGKGVDHPEVIIEQIWQQILNIEDQIKIRQFAIEFEFITNPVSPMPQLSALLKACRQQNMTMGIISNAQFYTPLLFEWFLSADPQELGFDAELLFFSFQYQVAKPSPALFEMAADKLKARGINVDEVLYVGNDMLNDIYPAHAVGFQTALFAGDRRSLRLRKDDSRCIGLKPDLVVTELGQLAQYI